MGPLNLPEAIASAIAAGDVIRFEDVHQPNMTLEKIAKHAARHGRPQLLQWCCDQGFRPPRTSFNSSFFEAAVSGASPAIFQILIDNGVDINAHESEFFGDALYEAVFRGHYDFAKWLLEHGHRPTPDEPYHGGSSAIYEAVCGDAADERIFRLLLDYGHDLEKSGAGVEAADEGDVDALRLFLDHGINTEDRDMSWCGFTCDEDGDNPDEASGTALYRACRQGHVECVELLLERGADPLAKDLAGTSCVDIARQRGFEDVVRLLEDRLGISNSASADQSLLGFIKRLLSRVGI
jgi:ankyrin repeat protein